MQSSTLANSRLNNRESIIIKGVRVHNLKNISVQIPKNTLTVITGPSGSGKSSIAFDTIHAEGQRRYIESFSTYARQFLEQVEKPDVDVLSGLTPTIAILQKTTSFNPRSTVGTTTEIYDYLRVLYARIAQANCPNCKKPIQSQTTQQMVDTILSYDEGSKLTLYAPIAREKKGEFTKELIGFRQKGFTRARINGEMKDLSEDFRLDKNKKHNIDISIDRIVIRPSDPAVATRLFEAVELALKLGKGLLIASVQVGTKTNEDTLSQHFACTDCEISLPEPEPRTFSFNSPLGACKKCDGIGTLSVDEEDEEEDTETESNLAAHIIKTRPPCPLCNGRRLSENSLAFTIQKKSIIDLCELTLPDALTFVESLKLTDRQQRIAHGLLREIKSRIRFLLEVGVSYITLGRSMMTLSGGESQRIRLASQIGSSLVGITYILDEPSIGLHPRDNVLLIQSLKKLRDLGNTVIVVEHDEEIMRACDWIIDIGPGAGKHGGELIYQGLPTEIHHEKNSLTGKYLSGEITHVSKRKRRKPDPSKTLSIQKINVNNIKNLNVDIPMGLFTCVTGVSGGGKSSLVMDTLVPLLARDLYKSVIPEMTARISYPKNSIEKIIPVDQSPIGRTPRSNPATYTGLFSHVRTLFSQLPESKIRAFKPGRFSFNVKGGRCEACKGDGARKISMNFMADVYVPCDECKGTRFKGDTLQVRFKGRNISEILNMPVEEALEFFKAIPLVNDRLKVMTDVGLGYLTLGQSAPSLSGGESQRIKLSSELARRSSGKSVYVLDEPSTGLHFDDIRKLLDLLQRITDQGNTVIVIEHNLDIISAADWVIDMGPEGGPGGGAIVAEGTPEQIAKNKNSRIAPFLKPLFT